MLLLSKFLSLSSNIVIAINSTYLSLFNKIIFSGQSYDLQKLENLEQRLKTDIYNTEDLRDDLIDKGYIIKDFSEYYKGLYRRKRKEKGTQMKLF